MDADAAKFSQRFRNTLRPHEDDTRCTLALRCWRPAERNVDVIYAITLTNISVGYFEL